MLVAGSSCCARRTLSAGIAARSSEMIRDPPKSVKYRERERGVGGEKGEDRVKDRANGEERMYGGIQYQNTVIIVTMQ